MHPRLHTHREVWEPTQHEAISTALHSDPTHTLGHSCPRNILCWLLAKHLAIKNSFFSTFLCTKKFPP
jgi:hypothetical protein